MTSKLAQIDTGARRGVTLLVVLLLVLAAGVPGSDALVAGGGPVSRAIEGLAVTAKVQRLISTVRREHERPLPAAAHGLQNDRLTHASLWAVRTSARSQGGAARVHVHLLSLPPPSRA